MPTPVIQLKNLSYAIGGRIILEDVSLDIYEGEIFAVLGLSGTGKTTLLRLITGLIRPQAGDIVIYGQNICEMDETDMNDVRARMGLVFQYGALFDSLSVRENVGFRLYEQTNLPEERISPIVTEKLRMVGLAGRESLYPSELSGGMQKRVGIARALVSDPSIMLYDEPTSGLDPVIAATIDELIARLRDELHVTSVVVSHDIRTILTIADRLTLLFDGHVCMTGTPEEFKHSTDPIVRQFLEGRTEGPIQVL